MKKIGVLNGPNLNLLGKREPEVYGKFTLADVESSLKKIAMTAKEEVELLFFQSNSEGALIDFIHAAGDRGIEYVIFNPGAYTHTSIALHDAIAGTEVKVVEVHISNIHKREPFREFSYISKVSVGQIVGLGMASYELALRYVLSRYGI